MTHWSARTNAGGKPAPIEGFFGPGYVETASRLLGAGLAGLVGRRHRSPMAAQMNNYKKVVVSKTMDKATWQNSTLINKNVAAEIARLKTLPGKNIAVSGSGSLVSWLTREGLLDELDLLVLPVAVGRGKRLLEDYGLG